jgi:hypothetical protein
MATLWEMTVFSWSSNSWNVSGFNTAFGSRKGEQRVSLVDVRDAGHFVLGRVGRSAAQTPDWVVQCASVPWRSGRIRRLLTQLVKVISSKGQGDEDRPDRPVPLHDKGPQNEEERWNVDIVKLQLREVVC